MASVVQGWTQRSSFKVHVNSNTQMAYVHLSQTVKRSFNRFSEGRRLVTKTITYFILINRIKSPSSKETMFYFINLRILPKLPPKDRLEWKDGQWNVNWKECGRERS
jgi:hypothetical protein